MAVRRIILIAIVSSVLIAASADIGGKPQCKRVKPCARNEEYVTCIEGVCRAMNCTQKDQDIPCPDRWPQEVCTPGCICKENYLRGSDGLCIPQDQCDDNEPPVCGDNEILDECPSDCPADYCPNSEADSKKCPQPDPCPKPKCKCRFNFRRSDNGTCIPTDECPPFDCSERPNEAYTPCPPICPSDGCGRARLTGLCPFRIGIILECNPKCQCADGYGRLNGICVPFEECPNLCPENEEYNSCVQNAYRPYCTTELCQSQQPDDNSCTRGCICKEDYYRSKNGTCVPKDECEVPLCPEPFEEYTISRKPNCPSLDTCISIVARIRCDEPEEAGCTCKGGYLRLNETTSCIPTCQCSELANAPECQTPCGV